MIVMNNDLQVNTCVYVSDDIL